MAGMPHFRRFLPTGLFPILLIALLSVLTLMGAADLLITQLSRGLAHDEIASCPARPVALVLGCSPTVSGGRPNRYFTARIDAAAALYHAGKCRYVLVSGDNSRPTYDEPTAMRQALTRRGVPASAIVRDYAGFDTLDSILRAREIFGQDSLLIVSQEFHNQRALYIALRNNIEAHALNAADVSGAMGMKTRIREKLARVKTLLEVEVLGSQPKVLGVAEPIGDMDATTR